VHSDDLLRIDTVLSGLRYPVERWELLDYATRTVEAADPGRRSGSRTIHQLWTLPIGRYHSLDEVLISLSRTARGHPPRHSDRTRLRPLPDR
jgi:hypothetical protein